MSRISIIAGSSHPKLAKRIADNLGIRLTEVDCFKFKNDNTFVKIKECIRNQDVFIIQTSAIPVNDHFMELLMLIDAAKYASCERITAIMPYYPYVRSDKKDQPRISVTARLVADLLVRAGTNRVITMDLHADQITGFFRCRYDQFYASSVLLPYLKAKDLSDCCILSPDIGGMKRARFFAQELNLPLTIFNKQRFDNKDTAEVAEIIGTVEGLHCILIDDEISTGGSVLSVMTSIKEMGAKSLTAICIHGVFAQNAVKKLEDAGVQEIVCTDTLPVSHLAEKHANLTVLGIADILAEGIHRTHEGDSIGKMFGHQ